MVKCNKMIGNDEFEYLLLLFLTYLTASLFKLVFNNSCV